MIWSDKVEKFFYNWYIFARLVCLNVGFSTASTESRKSMNLTFLNDCNFIDPRILSFGQLSFVFCCIFEQEKSAQLDPRKRGSIIICHASKFYIFWWNFFTPKQNIRTSNEQVLWKGREGNDDSNKNFRGRRQTGHSNGRWGSTIILYI